MELTEKTLSSEIVFDGKIMTVRKDEIELPTGHKSSREVVEHSGGVVILAICQKDEEGKILMVKQFRYPLSEPLLELPAGKLEKGEDPLEAAKRELHEETGYEAAKWEYLGYIFTSPGYSNEKLGKKIAEQSMKLMHVSNLYYTEPANARMKAKYLLIINSAPQK